MAVRDVLLDTNAYAAFKRGMPEAVEVIAHTPRIGISKVAHPPLAFSRGVDHDITDLRPHILRLVPGAPTLLIGHPVDYYG